MTSCTKLSLAAHEVSVLVVAVEMASMLLALFAVDFIVVYLRSLRLHL